MYTNADRSSAPAKRISDAISRTEDSKALEEMKAKAAALEAENKRRSNWAAFACSPLFVLNSSQLPNRLKTGIADGKVGCLSLDLMDWDPFSSGKTRLFPREDPATNTPPARD